MASPGVEPTQCSGSHKYTASGPEEAGSGGDNYDRAATVECHRSEVAGFGRPRPRMDMLRALRRLKKRRLQAYGAMSKWLPFGGRPITTRLLCEGSSRKSGLCNVRVD